MWQTYLVQMQIHTENCHTVKKYCVDLILRQGIHKPHKIRQQCMNVNLSRQILFAKGKPHKAYTNISQNYMRL